MEKRAAPHWKLTACQVANGPRENMRYVLSCKHRHAKTKMKARSLLTELIKEVLGSKLKWASRRLPQSSLSWTNNVTIECQHGVVLLLACPCLLFSVHLSLSLLRWAHYNARLPTIFVRSSETKRQQNKRRDLHIPHSHFFIAPFHLLDCLSNKTMPTAGVYLMWGRMVTGMLKAVALKLKLSRILE